MTRVLGVVMLAVGIVLTGACGGATRVVDGVPHVDVPASAEAYSTDARSNGVRGGEAASDAEELLEKHLKARGHEAEADGALADAAAWFLRRAYQSEDGMSSVGQEVANIVAGHGRDVAMAIGSVEVTLDDFPRSVAPGGSLRLKGEATTRYERTSIFATSPDGTVKEIPMTAQAIDASVALHETGVYQLEIMGYGADGPVGGERSGRSWP